MSYVPTKLKRWQLPDHYAGAQWPDYYVFLGRHRDSDDLVESNFECGLDRIGGETETVKVIRESHWAVGWVEWIGIHQSDAAALKLADECAAELADYPILDENDFSEREWNSVTSFWESCSVRERAEYCKRAGINIFAARRAEFPADDSGALFDLLRD